MKPTKMRNMQIYRASLEFRSRQLASPLSKDLRKKYGKRSARVIEGDTILIVRGEYKEISGKVIKSNAANGTIAIEDVKKEKGKGDKIDVMVHASNVVITSLDTTDKWRRARLEGKKSKVKNSTTGTVANVKPTASTKPADSAQSSSTKPADSAQSSSTKPADSAQSSSTKPADSAQSSSTKPADSAQSSSTKPADSAQSSSTKPADSAQSSSTKPADSAQSSSTKPAENVKPTKSAKPTEGAQ